jgi:Cu(I)/Ag(I) efflux system membrane fusion protein
MRLVSIVLLYTLLLVSCSGGDEQKDASDNKPKQPPVSSIGESGTRQMMAMLQNYYELKDALVTTSAGKADAAANKLSVKADSLIAYLQADSMKGPMLIPHLDTIKAQVKIMTGMMDEGCEKKRINFDAISATFYIMLKKAELKNANIYHQYCPMAFNDKGAYWMSNMEEIKNPYFGNKMLECGEVADILN